MLNGCCGIYQQPAVPASDIAQYGIKILKHDENALPKYPEKTRVALQRYVASCPCALALLPLKQSIDIYHYVLLVSFPDSHLILKAWSMCVWKQGYLW